MEEVDNIESQYALQVAFQTMKERCQKLQARLASVEEENACLRQQYEKNNSMSLIKLSGDENNIIQSQQV